MFPRLERYYRSLLSNTADWSSTTALCGAVLPLGRYYRSQVAVLPLSLEGYYRFARYYRSRFTVLPPSTSFHHALTSR